MFIDKDMYLKSVVFGYESDVHICSLQKIPNRPRFLVLGSAVNQMLQFVIISVYCTSLGHATDSEAQLNGM
jgi:hypothetical protein